MTSSPNYSPSDSPQHPSSLCPELDRSRSVPREYFDLARQILTDCGVTIDSTNLRLIVEVTLEVLSLFFAAALHESAQSELHDLFENFLMRCFIGCRTECTE